MKKLVFGLLVAVSLALSVGCAFATVDISQTHWQLPDRGFSGGSRVYPVDTVLTYADLSALRNSLNDSMQSRSAQLTYSGSFYFITMVRDGDIYWLCNGNGGRYRTAVESTDEPSSTVNNFNQTIIDNSSGSASGSTGSPYVSSSWQEKELLGKIYEKLWFINEWLQITKDWVKEVNYNVKNVNTNINNNVVPALVAINNNLSSMLTDTVFRLSSIQSASWASVDAENRILSTLTGIGNQLGSVIRNGQLQVNTSPLEARLDKLISMYSKVNGVVLDTASVTGGQITGAVGGELKDVVFWGDTSKVNNTFVSADGVAYTLNDTPVDINGLTLRSVNLGSTIPSYIANDPVLYAGVWRKGTDYIVSDTYNASTGEYVQRIGCAAFDGLPLVWGLDTTSFPDNPYFVTSIDVSLIPGCPKGSFGSEIFVFHPLFSAGTWGNVVYGDNYIALGGDGSSSYLGVSASATLSTVEQLHSALAGTEFYFIRYGTVLSESVTSSTIAIPEGSSYISSYNVRITGKYETYDSYTQTADIVSGIGRTEALLLTIETTLSKICDKVDDAAANVNNTVVNITDDNDKFNVFYITDVNGETQPVTEFAGDLTGASGKLLSLLYRLVFADALGGVDDDLSGFEDFFTSQEPVTATQGVDDTVNEVADVWAS